ncbi:SDR family oxidoreductase [Pontibacter chitinilyticus]|uniref:SDR family oxidoreductase n=1 Tax=Pontibacter chitinilyticus TaxID=2674989 RepID=UPI00321A4D6F
MARLRHSTVLITGGASGIGRLMGQLSLERGIRQLVIWDVNAANLQQTAADLQAHGYTVFPYLADVADAQSVQLTAEQVLNEVGVPDILINNAGMVVGKPFAEHTYNEIKQTLDINTLGPMLVTRAFLPEMLARGSGHIVNIASAAGLLPNPRMSVYAASKWAVVGWSENLRLELEASYPNLHVTTVTPSYIDTGMFAGVKAPILTPLLKPAAMAVAVLNAVEQNRILLRKPAIVHLLPVLRGILPTRVFDYLVGRVFQVYTSMDHFTGRPTAETHEAPSIDKNY